MTDVEFMCYIKDLDIQTESFFLFGLYFIITHFHETIGTCLLFPHWKYIVISERVIHNRFGTIFFPQGISVISKYPPVKMLKCYLGKDAVKVNRNFGQEAKLCMFKACGVFVYVCVFADGGGRGKWVEREVKHFVGLNALKQCWIW